MVAELPILIEFSLPVGWQAAPPDEVGAPEVAFAALHPSSTDGFTTNLTIAGEIRDPALPIATIAARSVRRLEGTAESVNVRDRKDFGRGDAPGMAQVLDIEMGQGKRLLQYQVYLSMDDVHDPRLRAVFELVLTCRPDQLDDVLPDFQRFVGTIRAAGS